MSDTHAPPVSEPRHEAPSTRAAADKGAAEGAHAGSGFANAMKGAYNATEELRHGINNAMDNAIQPSAAREKDRELSRQQHPGTGQYAPGSETARDQPGRGTGPHIDNPTEHETVKDRSVEGVSEGSSGFSKDAEKLWDKVKDMGKGR